MIDLICTRTWGTCRKAVALLDERGIEYRCRDYVRKPPSEAEIRGVLRITICARAMGGPGV